MGDAERGLGGTTAVVMGASAGIGFATARALVTAGATVVITGRHSDDLDAAVARIDDHKVTAVRVDGRNERDVRGFFTRTGEIDHLVVVFGSDDDSATLFRDTEPASWRRHFDDKFFAHLLVLRHALPHMRRGGSITMVTGGAARSAAAGASVWAATDGAMDAVIPTLAVEFAPLRINAVSPGMIHTRWWDRVPDARRERIFGAMARHIPAGRIGTPDDVAHAVRFLAENSYVTGVVLGVDGGAPLVG